VYDLKVPIHNYLPPKLTDKKEYDDEACKRVNKYIHPQMVVCAKEGGRSQVSPQRVGKIYSNKRVNIEPVG